MDYMKVRVTLAVPTNYLPKDTKEPEKMFSALLTAALIEFRIKVVKVNRRDLMRRK